MQPKPIAETSNGPTLRVCMRSLRQFASREKPGSAGRRQGPSARPWRTAARQPAGAGRHTSAAAHPRRLAPGRQGVVLPRQRSKRSLTIMKTTIILAGAVAVLLAGARLAHADEWAAYGRDLAGTRFSPLKEITPANVAPLMIDGRLYLTTGFNRVIALDPATGKQLWAYDPKVFKEIGYGDGLINRG